MYKKRYDELDVLELYITGYDKEFYLREISKLAKIPLRTTQNLIAKLEENNILRSISRGKNKYFRLNLDNMQTKFSLLQAETKKTKLFVENYPVFKTFLKELKADALLIVFGSFAKMMAGKDSDLDLLVISKQDLPSHLLPYKVHKIELSEKAFSKAIENQETLMKEIEDNHIILNNHSFYVNTMWRHHGN